MKTCNVVGSLPQQDMAILGEFFLFFFGASAANSFICFWLGHCGSFFPFLAALMYSRISHLLKKGNHRLTAPPPSATEKLRLYYSVLEGTSRAAAVDNPVPFSLLFPKLLPSRLVSR